jgi:hypothetical protein
VVVAHTARKKVVLSVVIAASALAVLVTGTALGSTPGRLDSSLTVYVHAHQPWVPLQARGIERVSDSNPSETSFWVFTTIRPYTNQHEAEHICSAVAADLHALDLPISISVMGRPEATIDWDTPQHSCDAPVPAALASGPPVSQARVAVLLTTELKTFEHQQRPDVTGLICHPPGAPIPNEPAVTASEYPCSFTSDGTKWTCSIRPTGATLAGYNSTLGSVICVRPLR